MTDAQTRARDAGAKKERAGRACDERVGDTERTRAELLVVANEVFADEGFAGARVDEIDARTSTAKRMIFYYFGGKKQLYLAVLEEAYPGIRSVERTTEGGGLSPREAVWRIAGVTFDHHVEHEAFIRLVVVGTTDRGRFIRQLESLREFCRTAIDLLEGILERGRVAGEFRSDVEAIDVHLMIGSYCVFRITSQHTLGCLFGQPFSGSAMREHLRAMFGEIVVSWLTDTAAQV